jgi:endonuclease YncB( thermonuclease family)
MMDMRIKPVGLLFALGALFLPSATHAGEPRELFGTPMVQDSGLLMLDGQEVRLWGIATLAGDQQCWQNDRAWSCGEQATAALKHHIGGWLVRCQIKDDSGDGRVSAICLREQQDKPYDIARYLVAHGWAMDQRDVSGGLYAMEEGEARQKRRGVWTSRFQTAADWRDGIQRYVDYEAAPEPQATTTIVNNNTINNTVAVPFFTVGHPVHPPRITPPPPPTATAADTAPPSGNVYDRLERRKQQQNAGKPVGGDNNVYNRLEKRQQQQRAQDSPPGSHNAADRLEKKQILERSSTPGETGEQLGE